MRYPVAIETGNGSVAYGIIFPDVPGCTSAGDTLDEAINNAIEALEGYFEFCVEDGDTVPLPGSIDDHYKKSEYQGYTWAFIEVNTEQPFGKPKRFNVSMPEGLVSRIDALVSHTAAYKNRSDFLVKSALSQLQK